MKNLTEIIGYLVSLSFMLSAVAFQLLHNVDWYNDLRKMAHYPAFWVLGMMFLGLLAYFMLSVLTESKKEKPKKKESFFDGIL